MKSLGSILDPGLLAHSQQLHELTGLLTRILPLECNGHFHVASLRVRTLVLISDSPVWATRLRLASTEIVRLLNQHGHSIAHVEIRTRIQRITETTPALPATSAISRHLSDSAGQCLASASAAITDTKLRHALLKLSQRAKKT